MKSILLLALATFLFSATNAQTSKLRETPDSTKKILKAEASCGQCNFKMAGAGCQLAVRIDGKSYFVDGTAIDEHGDAHASDGFCEVVKKAEVQGEIVDNRFKATYFKIVKPAPKKDGASGG